MLTPALATAAADRLLVVADPARLLILHALLAGPCLVGDIGRRVGIPPGVLSHHLRVLRACGLITADEVRSNQFVYSLAPAVYRAGGDRPGDVATFDLGGCRLALRG